MYIVSLLFSFCAQMSDFGVPFIHNYTCMAYILHFSSTVTPPLRTKELTWYPRWQKLTHRMPSSPAYSSIFRFYHYACFAHQSDDTHSYKYTKLFLHLFQWIVFCPSCVAWHWCICPLCLCPRRQCLVTCQDMVQWSPPDIKLTSRGQTTKRKYNLTSPKYTHKCHCAIK